MIGQDSRSPRRIGVALFALSLLHAGCTAMITNLILGTDTAVSLTVRGNDATLSTLASELGRQFGVETAISAVETGVMIVDLVGTYAEIVHSLRWIADLGLDLVANDDATAALLQTALVAFLK